VANTAGNIKQQAQETASNLADKAKDTAGNLVDKAKQAAGNVADKARDLASNVGDRVDTGVSSVGKGMESLAGTIRDRGPSSGVLGSATAGVAGAMDSTGRYLEEQGLSGMAEDLTGVIRRNPIPAVLVGIGLGFLLARLTRR
jgi:phage-related tail protein